MLWTYLISSAYQSNHYRSDITDITDKVTSLCIAFMISSCNSKTKVIHKWPFRKTRLSSAVDVVIINLVDSMGKIDIRRKFSGLEAPASLGTGQIFDFFQQVRNTLKSMQL